ncbi:MAG: SMC-Scp complex subunit ScpB [Candidatus Makaraimicrobium thalassicum]|nr:MAG: SMC-Scp complex subunit ScpB [Candidatus Omnitrophota bacterium]
MENIEKTKNVIEALLIVSEGGLSGEELKKAIADSDAKDIAEGIRFLKEEYSSSDRAFNIAEIAGKYRIVTKPEYLPWINNLYQKEVGRLTGPSMETLAVIAYKQLATRAEVENIRGVNVGGVLKALLDKGLIRVKGRKDVIGRPLVYGTTEKFLRIFGLNSLDDLPALRDFSEDDLEYGRAQEPVRVEEARDGDRVPCPVSRVPDTGRERRIAGREKKETDDNEPEKT